jgi:hypothetical protein
MLLIMLCVVAALALGIAYFAIATMIRGLRHEMKFEDDMSACVNALIEHAKGVGAAVEDALDQLAERQPALKRSRGR